MTPEDRRRLYGGRPAVSPTAPIDASGAGFVNPRPLRQDNRSNDGFWSINQYQRPQPSATPTATATPTPGPTSPPIPFDIGPAVPWLPPEQLRLKQTFGYPGGNVQWSDLDQAVADRFENRIDSPINAPHVAMDYFGPTANRPHTALDFAETTPNRPHTALDYVAPQTNSPHTAMDYADVVPNRPHTAMTYIDPQTVASAGGRSPLFDTGNDWQGGDQTDSLAPPWWKETGNAGGSPVSVNTPAPEVTPAPANTVAEYIPTAPDDPAIPVTNYDETPIIADRGGVPSPIDNPSNDWLGGDLIDPTEEVRRREAILADARNTGRLSNSNNLALGALLNNNFGGMDFTRETPLSPVDPGRILVGGVEQSPGGTTEVPQYGPELTDRQLADMDAERHRNMQSTPPDTRGNMLSNPSPIPGDTTPPPGMEIVGTDKKNGQFVYKDQKTGKLYVNPGTGTPLDPTNGLATNRQFDRATFGGVTPTVFRDPRGSAIGNLAENNRNFNAMLMASQAFGGTPNLNQPDEVSRRYGQIGHLDEDGQYVSDGAMGGGVYNPEAFRAFVYGSQNRTARTNPNTGRSFGGGQPTSGVGSGGG